MRNGYYIREHERASWKERKENEGDKRRYNQRGVKIGGE
jgi:hypothetical protein